MFTVFARTRPDALSIFLVERGAAGLEVGRHIEKMGVRASETAEVSFEETPATCVLGELHEGLTYLREILAKIRVMTAGLALGVARAAFEDALAYAAERKQFGKPINRFQAVQAHLAEMAVQLEAARRLTYWAAWRSEAGLPNEHEASMAKLFASEAALDICDRAARVLASYGYARDFAVERYLRDVRFTLIGGGTSEILRVHIARGLKP
jgi:butyryl-CoA dehydrogenase